MKVQQGQSSQPNFTGRDTVIKAITKKGSDNFDTLMITRVVPLVKKQVPDLVYSKSKSPGVMVAKNYTVENYEEAPNGKEITNYLFETSLDQNKDIISKNTTRIEKNLVGRYQMEDGLKSETTKTFKKTTFVQHLVDLIVDHLIERKNSGIAVITKVK